MSAPPSLTRTMSIATADTTPIKAPPVDAGTPPAPPPAPKKRKLELDIVDKEDKEDNQQAFSKERLKECMISMINASKSTLEPDERCAYHEALEYYYKTMADMEDKKEEEKKEDDKTKEETKEEAKEEETKEEETKEY